MLPPNHRCSYVQHAQTISIYHAVYHIKHTFSTQPTKQLFIRFSILQCHTTSPLSPIFAYPPPSSPQSHYHTPSPFLHMLYKCFLSTSKKPPSRSKWVKVLYIF